MKRSRVALFALAAAGAGALVAGRRQTANWRAAVDPDGPDFLRFPDGEAHVITATDGANLSAWIAGDGPTVVLAHGWTNNHTVWAPVARRLVRDGHRVIAYDQRGHGQSTTGRDPFTISRLGADLRDVLDALDVQDAVLAGHSMGGMTIMALIGEDPEAIKKRSRSVVLVSTAAAGLGRSALIDSSVARVIGSSGIARLISSPVGPRLVRSAVGVNPRQQHLDAMRSLWVATPGSTISDAFAAIAVMDLRAGLAACPVPATIVVGSRDQLTRKGLGKEIADSLPGSHFEVIEGAGHMLPLEEPDRIADLLAKEAASAVLR